MSVTEICECVTSLIVHMVRMLPIHFECKEEEKSTYYFL